MKKYILLTIFVAISLYGKPYYKGNYKYKINTKHSIPSDLKMPYSHGRYRGCPNIKDLRYLKIRYFGFDGKTHDDGELIVHRNVAKEVLDIFKKLYDNKYPINRMELIEKYKGDDFSSIEADNTSAYNCRIVTGGRKLSNHAYGTAIDINPLENPYVSRSGHIAHKCSRNFGIRNRKHHRNPCNNAPKNAVISKTDKIVDFFRNQGWRWGGDWNSVKDYQHFDKPGAQQGRTHRTALPTHTKTSYRLNPKHVTEHPHDKPTNTFDRKRCKHPYLIVGKDETLSLIKRNCGVSIKKIESINPGIKDGNKIRVGQRIQLPK